jgi:acyl-CoA synthetase (AMP-forming)/AMP-acid ligase II
MRIHGSSLSLEGMLWMGDYPSEGERRFPGRVAIVGDEGSLTYKQLDEASDRFATWLQRQGFGKGTRIAYLGKNSELMFPVLFGCIRAGCVLVPINWRFAVPEIAYVVLDSESRVLIHGAELAESADRAVSGLSRPVKLLSTKAPAGGEGLPGILLDAPKAPPMRCDDPDAVALQLYTSGTTGKPKGVMESHRKLSIARWMEMGSPHWADWNDDDILLSAMPNFHSGGLSWMLIGLLRQLTCILTADPSPANQLALGRTHQVTRNFIVPAVVRMLVDMVEASHEKPPPFKSIFYGAAPMDVELIQRCQRSFEGCGFAQYYGMTEVCGAATFFPPAEHRIERPERLRSVGLPLPGFELEIRDPAGQVLGPNRPGEIYLRSPTVMDGYWHLPEATAEVLLADGWYRTGDGGYVDEEGYLYITDRIKDMIVSGAENIYPAEVEQALRLHPAIQDVVVVGTKDARWGEAVCAVAELRPGKTVTLEELREFARAHIAGYKLPRDLRVVEQLPRTATGKLQRGSVRAQIAKAAAN